MDRAPAPAPATAIEEEEEQHDRKNTSLNSTHVIEHSRPSSA
jgi:hypothetical protein